MLVLAATPIGNSHDASKRLRDLLRSADLIAAEDTRKLAELARRIGVEITGTVVSLHEHNEQSRAAQVLDAARTGTAVLVTDAGMPSVSDPGFRIVTAAVEAGVPVTCAPGPSAALAALALSGLPTDRFCFEGFLPRKPGERARALAALATEPRTQIYFEAPHRIRAMLAALVEAFGADRPAAVARELTKTYEEVVRGTLGELQEWSESKDMLGEFVVVVGGAPPVRTSLADAASAVRERVAAGERLKDAARAVAAETGHSARDLYEAGIAPPQNATSSDP